ncbi:hypothetical protein FY034_13240 [Trichlorobacter lovleyi]|uniref:hypothetical protein n=1 Tax=Trichlorobacter lovleyi TaxID=313985 RepID=UPI00223FF994|nr:hypothetical protein [Trichlorobacter lovleyi]QOX79854.1 hypothetical protein FY034_13240 [Trichlorobacter lovleyi]
MSKLAECILTESDPDHPGLLLRYTDQKPGLPFGDLCALLLGAGFAGLGIIFISQWEGPSSLFAILINLVIGGLIIFGAWGSIRSRRKGLDIWYQVSVVDGVATFSCSEDNEPVRLTLSKIGRIWIERNTTNYALTSVYLAAYYDGQEQRITNILKLENLVGEDAIANLPAWIADYLNRQRSSSKKGNRQKETREDKASIQSGYRYDYAVDTPQTSRNQLVLAPIKTVWLYSGAFALVIYLVCVSPFSSMTFEDQPRLDLLVVGLVLTLAFFWATDKLGSCRCRARSYFRIAFTILIGFVLHLPVYFAREKFGIGWLIYPEPFISIPVMSWLVFRGFTGCDCGAKESIPTVDAP